MAKPECGIPSLMMMPTPLEQSPADDQGGAAEQGGDTAGTVQNRWDLTPRMTPTPRLTPRRPHGRLTPRRPHGRLPDLTPRTDPTDKPFTGSDPTDDQVVAAVRGARLVERSGYGRRAGDVAHAAGEHRVRGLGATGRDAVRDVATVTDDH
jgi:hypothetical protein